RLVYRQERKMMNEQTTETLIAEARVIWEADDLYPDQMIPRLVKALEAADLRVEEAEREHQGAHGAYDLLREKNRQTMQQRDALAAVVEAIQSWFNEYNGEDPGVGGWYALELNLEATRETRL